MVTILPIKMVMTEGWFMALFYLRYMKWDEITPITEVIYHEIIPFIPP